MSTNVQLLDVCNACLLTVKLGNQMQPTKHFTITYFDINRSQDNQPKKILHCIFTEPIDMKQFMQNLFKITSPNLKFYIFF